MVYFTIFFSYLLAVNDGQSHILNLQLEARRRKPGILIISLSTTAPPTTVKTLELH